MAIVGNMREEQIEETLSIWVTDGAGRRIKAEKFSYRVSIETAPLYEMGTRNMVDRPRNRSITGSFLLRIEDYPHLAGMERFEIYMETTTETTVFRQARLYDYGFENEHSLVRVSFVAGDIERYAREPKLAGLNNQELAQFVLSSEY